MARGFKHYTSDQEVSPGRKPHRKLDGTYIFIREPFSDEIEMFEPINPENGIRGSYLLYIHEIEYFLKFVMEMPESLRLRATDLIWDLRKVSLSTKDWHVTVLRRRDELPVVDLAGPKPFDVDFDVKVVK